MGLDHSLVSRHFHFPAPSAYRGQVASGLRRSRSQQARREWQLPLLRPEKWRDEMEGAAQQTDPGVKGTFAGAAVGRTGGAGRLQYQS